MLKKILEEMDILRKMEYIKELSIVSRDINEYEKSPYYVDNMGRAG